MLLHFQVQVQNYTIASRMSKTVIIGTLIWSSQVPYFYLGKVQNLGDGGGGGTSRKSLYLPRMTLFTQTILYMSRYFP